MTSLDTANALIHCLQLHKQPKDLEVIDLATLSKVIAGIPWRAAHMCRSLCIPALHSAIIAPIPPMDKVEPSMPLCIPDTLPSASILSSENILS